MTMARITSGLGLLLALWASGATPAGADDRLRGGGGDLIAALPEIPVRVANATDAMLSLSVTSALCAPRLILKPGDSIVVHECLRWGLVYHTVAVFYDERVVRERQQLLFLARPGQDWVFYPVARADGVTP
jgi:hypothetical protein